MSLTMPSWTAGSRAHHRWMLLVPVVFLVIALTIREGAVRHGNPVSDTSFQPKHVVADASAEYAADDDGTVDLKNGSLLAYDPGFASVRAGEWDVAIWGGGAYVALQQNGLTVAAFDVPVVVRGAKGVAVVPSMHQWRAPGSFLPDAGTDPAAWLDALDVQPLPEHFAAEHVRSIEAWRATEGPAQRGPVTASLLASATTHDLAALALAARPTRELAAAVRFDPTVRLYGLLHPSFRDAAWGFAPDGHADDETWIAALLLPRLERADAAASPLTIRRWGEIVADAFDASADADALRSAVLPALEQEIVRMAEDGYPVRALRFAEALRAAVGTGAALSDAADASYGRLAAMTPESLRATVLSDIAQPLTVVDTYDDAPADIERDPALEARAREQLVASGGMFTKDSSVVTAGAGTVDVEKVVFGLASGDRLLRFRYAPASHSAQAIIDGRVQPYDVPFDVYLEWETSR